MDGDICCDLTVENHVDNFFTTIADELAQKLPQSTDRLSFFSEIFRKYNMVSNLKCLDLAHLCQS